MLLQDLDFSKLPNGAFLLLAEGNAEEGFLYRVVQELNLSAAFVGNVRGENKLPTALKSLQAFKSRLRSLGLMFDANANFEQRLEQVSYHLNASGFSFDSEQLTAEGICAGSPPIGVFLSPGKGSGRIETLAIEEIRSREFWPCFAAWEECAKQHKAIEQCNDKSLVQMAISALDGDVHGTGTAFKRRILDVNHKAYSQVVTMIRALA